MSNLNVPKRPAFAARLPATVTQIDGSDYHSAGDLRPGAVLLVGCGNSGGQIAEDLAFAGRQIFLAPAATAACLGATVAATLSSG